MKISIREMKKSDIPKKVEWINNPENNQYLHYELPLSIEKTEKWFERCRKETNRFDAVIEVDFNPVGTIGLLNIDKNNNKAEYYIAMGETSYKGKGVAKEASRQILKYGFEQLCLNRIYLFTEIENTIAQRMFEGVGFKREGLIRQDVYTRGKYVDRVVYGVLKGEWQWGQ